MADPSHSTSLKVALIYLETGVVRMENLAT